MKAKKVVWLSVLLLFFSVYSYAAQQALVLTVSGPIGPGTEQYIKRNIAYAQAQKASAIILKLDTQSGLEKSMRKINEAIISAHLPVIAYVTPEKTRVESMGTYIMYASHLTAMAPHTYLGAAMPVFHSTNKQPEVVNKAVNEMASYMYSLAQLRGRNADWASLAVRDNAVISAATAKQLKVIDEIAINEQQLLQKMEGHRAVVDGVSEVIHSANWRLEERPIDWHFYFVNFLTYPEVTYLFLLLAFYGLFFEFLHPGAIVPGLVGIIALLLVIYAFQFLPVDYMGLLFALIGLALIVVECYVMSWGILGVGGLIVLMVGSMRLFDVSDPNYHIHWFLVVVMSLLSALIIFLIVRMAIRAHHQAIITGAEGLVKTEGIVLSHQVVGKEGGHLLVRVLGEIWEATSTYSLHEGDKIYVTKVNGLLLTVVPKQKAITKETGEKK